jgi:hypothetical protein
LGGFAALGFDCVICGEADGDVGVQIRILTKIFKNNGTALALEFIGSFVLQACF